MSRYFHNGCLIKRSVSLCFCFVMFLGSLSFSQDENKKWYFGTAAGLDFMSNPPVPVHTSAMTGLREGTASMADAFGKLLFYTDGVTIWNKVDQVMANGTGLAGNVSTTQSALIVKQPGSTGIYYVFTLGGSSGLFYSTVDMSLAAGMGSVTVKNIPLSGPGTEKLTGTKHCNGIDTWVVTHDFYSRAFRAILVTAGGVSSSPVLSQIGMIWTSSSEQYGAAKISANGKKLGCAVYHDTPGFSNFELYDFDNATGVVSNSISLSIPLSIIPLPLPIPKYPYGCEFSLDGSKFYGCPLNDTVIYQWDLCAGAPTAIAGSRYKIHATRTSALQLGPDGKIYMARQGTQFLGVINNPDLAGAACNYVDQGQSIAPAICSVGLPNFIAEAPRTVFTYSVDGAVSCNTALFKAPPPPTTTITACTATGYTITGFTWYFGDPASGSANTSTLSNPTHVYPGQGTYTACLVYSYNNTCGGSSTDTLKQEVKIGVLPVISSEGFNLCSGNSLLLSAPGAQTYSWSTGVTSSSITVSPSTTTTYTVSGVDVSGCPYISLQTVVVYTSPTVAIGGNTVLCPGYQVKLKAYGANTYSWSSGTTNSLNLNIQWATTTYTLYGNSNGCIDQKVITVETKRPDVLISGGNVTVCPGTAITLTVSGTEAYAWSTGANTSTTLVTPSITTSYSVQGMDGKACINTNSTVITVQRQQAMVDFSYTPVCQGTPSLAPTPTAGFNTGGVYSSPDLPVNAGSGTADLSSAVAGTYEVMYYLPRQACVDSSNSITTLTIVPAPPLNISPDYTITPGASVTLKADGGTSYTWSPSDFLSCASCSEPVAFPVEQTTFCVRSELNSCISETCTTISVICETSSDYSMPNAFTPNGDGINDQYCLQGWNGCMVSFHIRIFNAWGEQVYWSDDPGFCWDGIYNGRELDAGVFVYVIKARTFDKREISKKGNISLIR